MDSSSLQKGQGSLWLVGRHLLSSLQRRPLGLGEATLLARFHNFSQSTPCEIVQASCPFVSRGGGGLGSRGFSPIV